MKERTVGTITHWPFIHRVSGKTDKFEIKGYNSRDTELSLTVELPTDRLKRLSTIACAIRQLKSLFTDIKNEIEAEVESEEKWARGW